MATIIPHTPLRIPDILLPNKTIDLFKWSIIACDQYTSSHNYWDKVANIVGKAPSMLHLTIPEIYFESNDFNKKLEEIKINSEQYVSNNIFSTYSNSLLLIERFSPRTSSRKGLMVQVDLSKYDSNPNSDVAIKSTEKIVESRLPKRIMTRNQSNLDISHVLMLYEDAEHTLINNLLYVKQNHAYKTNLMMNGGKVIASFLETSKSIEIISKFFHEQTLRSPNKAIFAVGDGNHSLMSAKQIWLDKGANLTSQERWALVELVNIYDEGLPIEPIHRILIEANFELLKTELCKYGEVSTNVITNFSAVIIYKNISLFWKLHNTTHLAIEIIEKIIQNTQNLFKKIDFIHSKKEINNLASLSNNIGIILPTFDRDTIFKTVHNKSLFPRKSFSLGEAEDKKYYIETCLRS